MLSQGATQTIIFFEAFIFLQSKSYNTSFVLTSYAIIGASQVIGRVVISRYNYLNSHYINLIANVLIFIGSLLYFISIYLNIYILPIFSIVFGMGLGISTISKPLLISDIFEHNFSFYNGFYSLVLNLSRVIIPILIMFHIISFSLIYLLCTGLVLTCIGLACSYLILIGNK
ncbi:hypothetical protein fh0823_00620 [Francisella halioticida]|uniref:hypothetical protein n=1 Tax=Francisella halioticida TaxID=549298 RepID=UPI001AFC08DE|nr:hypothetical protein [Francisella halioticida]BCD89923.1 hypothetical protein fh0823_00620 [Francisella halioticida]